MVAAGDPETDLQIVKQLLALVRSSLLQQDRSPHLEIVCDRKVNQQAIIEAKLRMSAHRWGGEGAWIRCEIASAWFKSLPGGKRNNSWG